MRSQRLLADLSGQPTRCMGTRVGEWTCLDRDHERARADVHSPAASRRCSIGRP